MTLLHYFRALRPHHYIKNLLLFVPLLAAHRLGEPGLFGVLLVAFISFSLCASAIYLSNDLFDLAHDRQHPIKRQRPFAAGDLSARSGVIAIVILLILSLLMGGMVGQHFLLYLLAYFVLAQLYTFWLKRYVYFDCLALSSLYTLRLLTGADAVDVPLSLGLFLFSLLFFVSLAFVKRYAELTLYGVEDAAPYGKAYTSKNLQRIMQLSIAHGYAALLVFIVYLYGIQAMKFYASPKLLWLSVLTLLLWLHWLWHKAKNKHIVDDPIDFATRDRVSLLLGGILLMTFILATVV